MAAKNNPAPTVTDEEFIDVLKMKPARDYIKSLMPTPPAGGGGTIDESTFMKEKGLITNIIDIGETGIFYGNNVVGVPAKVTGDVLIMASHDINNNMGFFLMDDKMDLYVGGMPSSGQASWSKTIKNTNNLVIGDRTGEAQLTLDAKTANASHMVFKRNGTALSSIGAIAASNEELIIEQRSAADIRFILPADQSIVAKVGGKWHQLAYLDDLERPEVVSAYTATPTEAELFTAIKLLPTYIAATDKDEFWQGSHDFYVQDNPQTKMLLVKYRGVPTSTEASHGNFFFEKMTLAK